MAALVTGPDSYTLPGTLPVPGHLHLEASDGNVDRHWPPGTGQINWYALFEALGTLRHRPRLILELKRISELRRAAAWLAERDLAR